MALLARRSCLVLGRWSGVRRYLAAMGKDDDDFSIRSHTSTVREIWKSRMQKKRPAGERTMENSYENVLLPFSSDWRLQEQYRSGAVSDYAHRIRFGLILEDMDALASAIALQHCEKEKNIMVVTAAVDDIRLNLSDGNFSLKNDVMLEGFVGGVGRSSMEVLLRVGSVTNQPQNPRFFQLSAEEAAVEARFTMVARQTDIDVAHKVPRLTYTSKEGKQEWNRSNAMKKVARSKRKLGIHLPTLDEAAALHSLFLQGHTDHDLVDLQSNSEDDVDDDALSLSSTHTKSIILCQPQQRNTNNKIFGGMLMRKAYEQAFVGAARLGKVAPTVRSMDDIAFVEPVKIGDILSFTTHVIRSCNPPNASPACAVEVMAHVADLRTGRSKLTNAFHYTFTFPNVERIPIIHPRTYLEGLKWLEGGRRLSVHGLEHFYYFHTLMVLSWEPLTRTPLGKARIQLTHWPG